MADTPGVINSGADLLAMSPPDLSGIETEPSPDNSADASEAETFETPESLETPEIEAEPAEEEPPAEPEAEPSTEEQPVAAKGTTSEELPEGVTKGKDRHGKPGYFLEENRYKNIYSNHQLVQKVSEMLGEPATSEALELRNNAFHAQERLFSDLNSGDPKSQGEVLSYFLDEMTRAREIGEVGVDPAIPFAQTVYTTLRYKAPDAYAALRFSAAKDLVGEMFEEASRAGDESLWLSAQHFARALINVGKDVTDIAQVRTIAHRSGIPFYAKAEMQGLARGADPVGRLQAENARLNALLKGNNGNQQAAQFDTWFQDVSQTVKSGILDEAIQPALATVKDAWKSFPDDYQDLIVDRLNRKVTETIRADQGFTNRIKLLNDLAKRAASAQRRDEVGKSIRQAYVNRARLAVDAVKKPILEFAANRLKERADQNHARRTAAQNRTVPKGSAGTVPRSLSPNGLIQMKDNLFDPATALKQVQQLLRG